MCEVARRHLRRDGPPEEPWQDHPATPGCIAHSVADEMGAICSVCLFHVWYANPIRTVADGEPTLASICPPCERWLRERGLFRRDAIDALVSQAYASARRANRVDLLRNMEIEGPVM